MDFPPACPEVPVSELGPGLAYYRDRLGFTVDWSDEDIGLAGLSRDAARIFMSSAKYRTWLGNQGPGVVWLNLSSRAEVDALHAEWAAAGASIAAPPQDQPYLLYEFFARDPDGNLLRVFYSFGHETA